MALLVGLPVRLFMLIDTDSVPITYLTLFGILSFCIAIAISIDAVSSSKLVFK